MLRWLSRIFHAPEKRERWCVSLERGCVTVYGPQDQIQTLSLDKLTAVVVETNDLGPMEHDVWWKLFDDSNGAPVCFPQTIAGDDAIINRLMSLPGFDLALMISAMASVEKRKFSLWKREQEQEKKSSVVDRFQKISSESSLGNEQLLAL